MKGVATEWVVTWLWQGALLAVLTSVAMGLMPRANAATRYLVWWFTLAGVVCLGAAPAAWALVATAPVEAGWSAGAQLSSSSQAAFMPVSVPTAPNWLIGGGVLLWAGFSCWRMATLGLGVVHLHRVKGRCLPPPTRLERNLPRWRAVKDQGRAVELRVSDEVPTASMLGLTAPLIVLPSPILAELTHADLDHVILHEYGHVQRRDDWAALGQAMIEALAGWHPAVWWIGRQLRLEREVACDDWVVQDARAARSYALCLTKVAGLMSHRGTVPLTSRVVWARHELTRRMTRLLNTVRDIGVRPAKLTTSTSLVTLSILVLLLAVLPPIVTTQMAVSGSHIPVSSLSITDLTSVPGAGRTIATSVAHSAPPPVTTTLLRAVNIEPVTLLTAPGRTQTRAHRTEIALTSSALDLRTPLAPGQVATSGLDTNDLRSAQNSNPWHRVADAGQAVGTGATRAGTVTARAFRSVGSSLASTFSW